MATEIISKICTRCKQTKPLTEFFERKGCKNGYRSCCKTCLGEKQRRYRETENGKKNQRQGSRRYRETENGKKNQCKRRQNYRRKYPDRIKAESALDYQIKKCLFPRISTLFCIVCGKKAEDYHHFRGYASENWFDVQPLCKHCHIKIHRDLIPLEYNK